ncbi:hypothetical protein ACQJBY_053388 [Aegilops geniculata]
MEGSGAAGARGGGGGGPAPFLLKTYEMVDDPATDAVVSWSDASDTSFVVWNSPEFAARLLPAYFKHSNFSSFIRQLNTYGFRKIDPERWEFGNEYFVKGQKHLLKNIYRRKPIHSHSHQPGALPDNERSFFEDEIDRLAREKANLQAELWKSKQQESGTMFQIEALERRAVDMEQRQGKMIAFLQQASKNPHFVGKLVKMAEASSMFADALHKKRRLSGLDYAVEATETASFCDDHSATSRQEMGNLLNQHFSDKLKLGLCFAATESNLVTLSTQSSHEDNCSPHGRHPPGHDGIGTGCLPLVPQMMELSDTGTSICPSKSSVFTPAVNDEGLSPCHLSLTLASCSMDVDRGQASNADGSTNVDKGSDNPPEATAAAMGVNQKASVDVGTAEAPTPREDTRVAAEPAAPVKANDNFWEQFLTERPGDASSGPRDPSMDKEQTEGGEKDDREDTEQLKL